MPTQPGTLVAGVIFSSLGNNSAADVSRPDVPGPRVQNNQEQVAAAHAALGEDRIASPARQLGVYARKSMQSTTRLPTQPAIPTVSESSVPAGPRPTSKYAAVRICYRAVAKLMVKSHIRCGCCFLHVKQCLRDSAVLKAAFFKRALRAPICQCGNSNSWRKREGPKV